MAKMNVRMANISSNDDGESKEVFCVNDDPARCIKFPEQVFNRVDSQNVGVMQMTKHYNWRRSSNFSSTKWTDFTVEISLYRNDPALGQSEISVSDLPELIEFQIPVTDRMIKADLLCSYWDNTLQQWSSKGCVTGELHVEERTLTCKCNHLTEFAVQTLDAILPTPGNGTESSQSNQSAPVYFTAMGILILFVPLFIYGFSKDRHHLIQSLEREIRKAPFYQLQKRRLENLQYRVSYHNQNSIRSSSTEVSSGRHNTNVHAEVVAFSALLNRPSETELSSSENNDSNATEEEQTSHENVQNTDSDSIVVEIEEDLQDERSMAHSPDQLRRLALIAERTDEQFSDELHHRRSRVYVAEASIPESEVDSATTTQNLNHGLPEINHYEDSITLEDLDDAHAEEGVERRRQEARDNTDQSDHRHDDSSEADTETVRRLNSNETGVAISNSLRRVNQSINFLGTVQQVSNLYKTCKCTNYVFERLRFRSNRHLVQRYIGLLVWEMRLEHIVTKRIDSSSLPSRAFRYAIEQNNYFGIFIKNSSRISRPARAIILLTQLICHLAAIGLLLQNFINSELTEFNLAILCFMTIIWVPLDTLLSKLLITGQMKNYPTLPNLKSHFSEERRRMTLALAIASVLILISLSLTVYLASDINAPDSSTWLMFFGIAVLFDMIVTKQLRLIVLDSCLPELSKAKIFQQRPAHLTGESHQNHS